MTGSLPFDRPFDRLRAPSEVEGPDEDLFRRFIEGDKAMFEPLVRRYEDPLFAFLYRMTGNAADAEDAFQETFLRAFHRRESFAGRGKLKSWLYAIAVNVVRSRFRASARAPRTIGLGSAEGDTPREPTAPDAPPNGKLESAEDAERIGGAVARLPADQREVLLLRIYQDLSFPEIAAALDRPVGTVKSQMRYALKRLRGALQVGA